MPRGILSQMGRELRQLLEQNPEITHKQALAALSQQALDEYGDNANRMVSDLLYRYRGKAPRAAASADQVGKSRGKRRASRRRGGKRRRLSRVTLDQMNSYVLQRLSTNSDISNRELYAGMPAALRKRVALIHVAKLRYRLRTRPGLQDRLAAKYGAPPTSALPVSHAGAQRIVDAALALAREADFEAAQDALSVVEGRVELYRRAADLFEAAGSAQVALSALTLAGALEH